MLYARACLLCPQEPPPSFWTDVEEVSLLEEEAKGDEGYEKDLTNLYPEVPEVRAEPTTNPPVQLLQLLPNLFSLWKHEAQSAQALIPDLAQPRKKQTKQKEKAGTPKKSISDRQYQILELLFFRTTKT